MRRFAVPLFLALVASLAPASSAHAEDYCIRVWSENTIGPNIDTESTGTCVTVWPYGIYCHEDHTWVHPYVSVRATYCHPL
jgi:hypothetical protein